MRLKEIHAVYNKKSLEQDEVRPLFISKIPSKLPPIVVMQLSMAKGKEHWVVSKYRQARGI